MRAAVFALVLAVACDGPAPPTEPARFTIRGRWPVAPLAVSYRVEATTSPLPEGAFDRAVQRAATKWAASGVVGFRRADEGEVPDLTLGFRRGHHGACQPFGPGADVAHSGPTQIGTFVHFDLGRTWSEAGGDGTVSLFATTLHELGHVLGLGHVDVADAVMGVDPTRPTELSHHDLAGLHSLYGGGVDGSGDLVMQRKGRDVLVVRGVAPSGSAEFAVFDADGDGKDDLVVWRTDAQGHGELQLAMFAAGPQLVRTVGPFLGVVAPGARVAFAVGGGGERLLVAVAANGKVMPRQFDRYGVPELPTLSVEAAVVARATTAQEGDLDGDGRREQVVRRESR